MRVNCRNRGLGGLLDFAEYSVALTKALKTINLRNQLLGKQHQASAKSIKLSEPRIRRILGFHGLFFALTVSEYNAIKQLGNQIDRNHRLQQRQSSAKSINP